MAQNDDAVFSKRANSSSSSVVQYVCDCAKCKGSSWYAYRTVRRHRSIFGISTTKANLEASSNGKKGRRPSTGDDDSKCVSASDVEELSEINNWDMELSEHQSTDDELSSGSEETMTSDTSNDEMLSSDNEEILVSDTLGDETTTDTQEEQMFEMTDEISEHTGDEITAIMEENLSQNEHYESPLNETTSLGNILLWICMVLFRIYFKFKLTKAALLAICGLISFLLHHIAHPLSNIFPTTLHSLYKIVRSRKMEKTVFIVCPNDSCNQLYKPTDIVQNKCCSNIIFGKRCGHELGYYKNLAFSRQKWVPHKTFHFLPPSQWLKHMFNDTTFCQLIASKDTSDSTANEMKDVYDGQIWKEFLMDPLQPTSPLLCDNNNIGLLLNVDWFKPFKHSEYKVSAIMMTVLNLPRSERFKSKWTMVLGVIPGPTEPKGNINTFLKPIVDDLIDLWNGVPLHPSGKVIRAALLGVSCDMPALRKVSQFLGHKADLGCSRCTFKAEREPSTRGASGKMSYFTCSEAPSRTMEEVRIQAEEYQSAHSLAEAQRIQKKNGVRYSELLRLEYFDIIRMMITDPMHTFLLGMVHNEAKLCFSSMSANNATEFQNRIKKIRIPYDLGRLPTNIYNKAGGLTELTAQQWKNFACIYARPCLVGLIPDRAYQSMLLLCQIVEYISQPATSDGIIVNLYKLLHEHHKCFRTAHGKWQVSINYHMALHIPDVMADYGPPHGYWCFGYERMNGFLAEFPNSKVDIEPQIMNRILLQFSYASSSLPVITSSLNVPKSLKCVTTIESHQVFHTSPMNLIRLQPAEMRFAFLRKIDQGNIVDWPIELKHPSKCNLKIETIFYEELVQFCKNIYDTDIYVHPRMDKFGRCVVSDQIYSSEFNSTDRGSIVKAMFVMKENNELHPYYGRIQFFFRIYITLRQEGLQDEIKECILCYVKWMCFKSPEIDKSSKHYMVSDKFYEQDRIISPRRFEGRCTLAPAGKGSSFYVIELPR